MMVAEGNMSDYLVFAGKISRKGSVVGNAGKCDGTFGVDISGIAFRKDRNCFAILLQKQVSDLTSQPMISVSQGQICWLLAQLQVEGNALFSFRQVLR